MSTKARSVAFNRSSQSILEELAAPLGESSSRFGRVFPGATCVYMYISLICRHTEYVYIHREYILVYKVYILYIYITITLYIYNYTRHINNNIYIYIHTYFSPTISYIYIYIYSSIYLICHFLRHPYSFTLRRWAVHGLALPLGPVALMRPQVWSQRQRQGACGANPRSDPEFGSRPAAWNLEKVRDAWSFRQIGTTSLECGIRFLYIDIESWTSQQIVRLCLNTCFRSFIFSKTSLHLHTGPSGWSLCESCSFVQTSVGMNWWTHDFVLDD